MKRLYVFIGNALVMSVTAILLRAVAVSFNVYISDKIGAEGMGLFALIMSVYTFAVTFACSGINLATVRLVSEELERGGPVRRALFRCVIYSLCFGGAASLLLLCFAEPLGTHLLGDSRTVLSLRALSVSLPFISLTSVFSGYFTAVRRPAKASASNLLELLTKIALTVVFLVFLAPRGLEYACLAVVAGASLSEGASFIYMFVFYLFDRRRFKRLSGDGTADKNLVSRILAIALPVAFSSYLRSGLLTIEHILIPRSLKKSGASYSEALSSYGVVHGMVFPVILFPTAFIGSFSALIIPEMSALAASSSSIKDNREIKYIARRAMQMTLFFSIGAAFVFLFYGGRLGEAIYGNAEAGKFMRVFALLIPVMYLDGAVDAMLKGLGQQLASMRYNIIDASASVLLVLVAVPALSVWGYVLTVWVCECLNLALSLARLIKITGAVPDALRWIAAPLLCAAASACVSGAAEKLFPSFHAENTALTAAVIIFVVVYAALLRIIGAFSGEDAEWIYGGMKSAIKRQ